MKRLLLFSQLALSTLLLNPNQPAWAKTNTGVIVADGCVHGNGITKTVERQAADFNILETSGAYTIRIKSGQNKQQIKITGDANLLPLIVTSSQSNKLVIYPEKSICTETGITFEMNVLSLEALVSSGSDTISIRGINTPKFVLDMGGSSDVELNGVAHTLDVTMSGAGDLKARDLKTKESILNISGSSTANVYASERLKVDIIGAADVNYFGHPKKIEKEILGVGDLNPMD
jgi:hypothetical protein